MFMLISKIRFFFLDGGVGLRCLFFAVGNLSSRDCNRVNTIA